MALTKTKIDKFSYAKAKDVLWDGKLSGFGLRAYPSGKKSFILRYRVNGRKKLYTIGPFGVLTVAQARKSAIDALALVNGDEDPLYNRQKARRGETFQALCVRYISDHAKEKKKTWAEDERRINSHFKGWLNWRPEDITPDDISRMHKRIGENSPYEANRALALIRKIYKLAPTWKFVPHDHPNPASGIEKYQEKKRKRYALPDEVGAVVKAIDAEENIYVRALLWLYLLSGARKNELLPAKWEDLDPRRKRLRLPDTKANEEQFVTLNSAAMAVLDSLPRIDKNPYIFPGKRKSRHLVNISKPWARVRKVAGVEDLRLHDLRRTVGSWMTQSGTDLNTIKEALRHKDISTTLIYARLGEDSARDPMEDYGKKILAAAGRDEELAD